MATSVSMKVTMVILACMVVAEPYAVEAITCGQIAGGLRACFLYLRSGGAPPPACCGGVKSVNAAAKTTADRQIACGCLKQLASSGGFNPSFASGLPGKCGVNIGYPINFKVDCSKIR